MKQEIQIFVIGDRPAFGRVVSHLLAIDVPDWDIRYATYEQSRALWGQDVLRKTSLFVLELFRRYPSGLRAEGIGVARKLMEEGRRFLIISPIGISVAKGLVWSPEDKQGLVAICESAATNPRIIPGQVQMLDSLSRMFDGYLKIPTGHTTERTES